VASFLATLSGLSIGLSCRTIYFAVCDIDHRTTTPRRSSPDPFCSRGDGTRLLPRLRTLGGNCVCATYRGARAGPRQNALQSVNNPSGWCWDTLSVQRSAGTGAFAALPGQAPAKPRLRRILCMFLFDSSR